MEYNAVEDLKNIKENIYVMDAHKITQQTKFLLDALIDIQIPKKVSNKEVTNNFQTIVPNPSLTGKKYKF